MTKNKKRSNSLIKERTLRKILSNYGVKRISPMAIENIDRLVLKIIKNLAERLNEISIIEGRKTIKEKDIKNVLKKEDLYTEV